MSADISIIIPTHNRLWSLPKAVGSCRGTACEVEIIVVDDDSDDGTWAWLQDQPDVTALKGGGWGKPWAVNKGFEHARGRYVRFLDSDDWLHTDRIDAQVELAKEEGADLVVGGVDVYRDETRINSRPWTPCDDFIARQLGEGDGSHYSAFLFHRSLVEDVPHRPDYELRDDRLFLLEVALKSPDIAEYKPPVLCHRHHDRGRLQVFSDIKNVVRNHQHLTLYSRILRALHDRDALTMRRRQAAATVLWYLAHQIAYTHSQEGAEVADWVLELDPDFTPPESGLLGWAYRNAGFRWTERFIQLWRLLLSPFRSSSASFSPPFEISVSHTFPSASKS